MKQIEAKKIIVAECSEHYNNHECFTKCRCRKGTCIGTTKDNRWNEDLAKKIKEDD